MIWVALILVGMIALALAAMCVVLARQVTRFRSEAETARSHLASLQNQHGTALARVAKLEEEDRVKVEWLDNEEKQNKHLLAELAKRPTIVRKTYKILTVGMSGTGKTALTLKWANPLTNLTTLEGTKIERYERTVSHVLAKDLTVEHVFEVGDWGGEHIVDAQQELIVDEIHGLLMVVDLAGKDAKAVDPARIQQQLREFQPEALKFFFGPKTIASCKTVVLFINKSDLIAGVPADVEQQGRELYKRLIDDLEKYKIHLDVRVLVGSATYGHSTHHLFSHFVERILPKNAYDSQLLQRMKSDAVAADRAAANTFSAPLQAMSPAALALLPGNIPPAPVVPVPPAEPAPPPLVEPTPLLIGRSGTLPAIPRKSNGHH